MNSELEQSLSRELGEVAGHLVVPDMPALPTATGRTRWQATGPALLAAAVVVAVLATVVTLLALAGPDGEKPAPAPRPTEEDTGPVSTAAPEAPVVVGGTLYVDGEPAPGRWYGVEGAGTHWVGQRADSTWWWGFDAEPRRTEGAMDQPPATSPSGGYTARVIREAGVPTLVGADIEEDGEGLGSVELPDGSDPPARAVAVTDDALVVAGGSDFQWVWRPLVDGGTVDLADSAPGQVVLGSTGAGLLVNAGAYDATDGTQGEPYLAELAEDGTLTRLGAVPTHDVLEASEQWLAYVPPGTVGGEASGTTELQVQRVDGSGSGALRPPDGWLFVAPGFTWETGDRLLARVVTQDGGDEGLVRCRPAPASCVPVELP